MAQVYAAELPLDCDFEARAYAARRLWRAMNGRSPGPTFHELSTQRRERLALAVRALDARVAAVTIVRSPKLCSARRVSLIVPGKPTICAIEPSVSCKAASRLMRGGYRELLRQPRRKK